MVLLHTDNFSEKKNNNCLNNVLDLSGKLKKIWKNLNFLYGPIDIRYIHNLDSGEYIVKRFYLKVEIPLKAPVV